MEDDRRRPADKEKRPSAARPMLKCSKTLNVGVGQPRLQPAKSLTLAHPAPGGVYKYLIIPKKIWNRRKK
jgi:hypothetical protein